MAITWTKNWSASDDGTVLTGADLKNIQDDVSSGIEGNATAIQNIPVEAPTAGDDGSVLYYDHGSLKFDYKPVTDILPSGVILMWSGSIATIPSGWVICDGANGTPNLTDRFVIHADADSGGTNDVGDTGGASTHQLTVNEMPSHGHPETYYSNEGAVGYPGQTNGGTTNSYTSDSVGGDAAHNNRDKYYALAYIMKT